MCRTSVISVAVLCLLVVQMEAQCPVRCQCSDWTLNCRDARLTQVPTEGVLSAILKLDVSSNDIAILRNTSFKVEAYSSVEILLASDNKISYIEINALNNLQNLNYLDLSGNDLGYIDPEVFKTNVHLMSMNLNKNNIVRFSENGYYLPELVKLELEQCQIQRLPANFFKNMSNLKFLYLSKNSLSYLDQTNFKHLANLEEFDLSDNWFQNLQNDLLELHSSTKLDVSNNPWMCDCKLKDTLELYEWRKNSRPLICKNPTELRGKPASKSLINDLLHCDVKETKIIEYEDDDLVVRNDEPLQELPDEEVPDTPQENMFQKLQMQNSDEGDWLDETTPRELQSAAVGGGPLSAESESWIDDNQWWIICAAVMTLMTIATVAGYVQVKRYIRRVSIPQQEEDT